MATTTKMFSMVRAFAITICATSAMATIASANIPAGTQICKCCYTFANGYTICSEKECPDTAFCGCIVKRNEEGSVIGVRARCIAADDDVPVNQ